MRKIKSGGGRKYGCESARLHTSLIATWCSDKNVKRVMRYLDNCRSCERITISNATILRLETRGIFLEIILFPSSLLYTLYPCISLRTFWYIFTFALYFNRKLLLLDFSGKHARNLKEFLSCIFWVIKVCMLFFFRKLLYSNEFVFFLFSFLKSSFYLASLFRKFYNFYLASFHNAHCNVFNDRLLSWKNNVA